MQTTIQTPAKFITMYSKNHIMPRALGSLLEDVFSNGLNKVWGEEGITDRAHAPVNIQETDKSYELHLIAPGLKKEALKLNVDRSVLTISFEHQEEEQTEQAGKWLRNEYKAKSFKRSFTLNDKIDTSGISAKYTDGVLHVSLPKKDQQEYSAQNINVQ